MKNGRNTRRRAALKLTLAALLCAAAAPVAASDRSCQATGRDGAPKIGDAKAWEPRMRRGLTGLTASALEGVRKMPPHGGSLRLSDTEITRAITYMVNHSGGSWIEPVDRKALPPARTGEQ